MIAIAVLNVPLSVLFIHEITGHVSLLRASARLRLTQSASAALRAPRAAPMEVSPALGATRRQRVSLRLAPRKNQIALRGLLGVGRSVDRATLLSYGFHRHPS